MDRSLRLALAVLAAAAMLFAANVAYGLAHESAHAAVVEATGGHVYDIYINVFGTDAYTEHSPSPSVADFVLVEMAGLCATSLFAMAAILLRQSLLASFLALRTAIYALNYAPGTDISAIYAASRGLALALSLIIVVINVACVVAAVRLATGRPLPADIKRFTAGLSSSLWRARPARNN